MAQKVTVELVDDLDGTASDDISTVTFSAAHRAIQAGGILLAVVPAVLALPQPSGVPRPCDRRLESSMSWPHLRLAAHPREVCAR
jgi:hypothetical protein